MLPDDMWNRLAGGDGAALARRFAEVLQLSTTGRECLEMLLSIDRERRELLLKHLFPLTHCSVSGLQEKGIGRS